MIQNNVIHQSYIHGLKKILFLGSSCIYPKLAPQPLKEEYLLTGFFTEEISVDSLVATIIKFLNNPSCFDSREIRQNALTKYDQKIQAKRYSELFDSILNKNS